MSSMSLMLMSLLNPLLALDGWLFAKINQDWTNRAFDWFFPSITDLHRDPRSLLVVLPLLAFWIAKRRAYALKCLLAVLISVTLADSFAYRAIKSAVRRPRPPDSGIAVVLRTPRHAGFSFPSNHASNMFAVATVLSFAIPAATPIFFVIAALIGYSRIYVGVHFPTDVLGGALLGSLLAVAVWLSLRRWILKSAQPLPDEFNAPSAEGSTQ